MTDLQTQLQYFREILKPYLPSLPDPDIVNTANHISNNFINIADVKNKDHRYPASTIE